MPLTIQRLELLSPIDSQVLLDQLQLPYSPGVRMGPLGGILRWPPFAPYEAIFREAITSASPFYRLLCACRVYEGAVRIRKWRKEQCTRFAISPSLPKDPEIDANELIRMGFAPEIAKQTKRARNLFDNLKDYRNGIAHFLIEGKDNDFPIPHLRGRYELLERRKHGFAPTGSRNAGRLSYNRAS